LYGGGGRSEGWGDGDKMVIEEVKEGRKVTEGGTDVTPGERIVSKRKGRKKVRNAVVCNGGDGG
jgi:hypothetical protein